MAVPGSPTIKTEPWEGSAYDEFIDVKAEVKTEPDESHIAAPATKVAALFSSVASSTSVAEYNESHDTKEIKSEEQLLLYPDHEVKEEMVIGPTEIEHPVPGLVHHIQQECSSRAEVPHVANEPPIPNLPRRGPLSCDHCGKDFTSYSIRYLHKHYCDVCYQNILRKAPVAIQRQSLKSEKPFVCDQCDKRFSKKSHLIPHLQVHSGIKPFSCNQCDKRFRLKSILTNHLRSHSGVKPFTCNQCNKSFGRKCQLSSHLQVHSGVKPFSCNLCDKSFSQKISLTNHLHIIHSGAKPFPCNHCDKRFKYKRTLSNHILHIHSEYHLFSCNQCDRRFVQKNYLMAHLKVHSDVKGTMPAFRLFS